MGESGAISGVFWRVLGRVWEVKRFIMINQCQVIPNILNNHANSKFVCGGGVVHLSFPKKHINADNCLDGLICY